MGRGNLRVNRRGVGVPRRYRGVLLRLKVRGSRQRDLDLSCLWSGLKFIGELGRTYGGPSG